MNRAVIALGSNIEPQRHVEAAVARLAEGHRLLARSQFVTTAPIGRADQPDYLNGAVLIETSLDRDQLKDWLRQVEIDLGRVRTADRYAPRTIDLDIAVFNGQIVDEDVRERDFLRRAVAELCPELSL